MKVKIPDVGTLDLGPAADGLTNAELKEYVEGLYPQVATATLTVDGEGVRVFSRPVGGQKG